MLRKFTTLPTTSGRPLTVGARLRYQQACSAPDSPLKCEWRERTGIVASIHGTGADVRVTFDADAGYQHHASLIRLGDGSVQMDSSKYVAEILAPAPAAQRETA